MSLCHTGSDEGGVVAGIQQRRTGHAGGGSAGQSPRRAMIASSSHELIDHRMHLCLLLGGRDGEQGWGGGMGEEVSRSSIGMET